MLAASDLVVTLYTLTVICVYWASNWVRFLVLINSTQDLFQSLRIRSPCHSKSLMSFVVKNQKRNNPANPVAGQALLLILTVNTYVGPASPHPEKVRESGLLNFSRRNFNTLAHLFDVSDRELVFEIKTTSDS